MRGPRTLSALLALAAATWFSGSLYGQYMLSASHETALPGATTFVTFELENLNPVRAFQFGTTHDGTFVGLEAVSPGPVIAAANGGLGPDYFFADSDPIGGPGFFVACVLSFATPFAEVPGGAGQVIAVAEYTIDGLAVPGATSVVAFSSTLGDPPVACLVSLAAGITHTPIQIAGSIEVSTAPITGLQCMLDDPCSCGFSLSWTNQDLYDEVRIFLDGALWVTLPGSSTSHSDELPTPGAFELCVVGVRSGQPAASICCTVSCPTIPSLSVTQLACSQLDGCDFELTWNNPQVYRTIEVTLDGVRVATLPGTATQTVLSLAITGSAEVCVTGSCQAPSAPACCTISCEAPFVRGDANADGTLNIADPIFVLAFLFSQGTPATCADSVDANDDGAVDIGDPVSILGALFGGSGVPLPAPMICGGDPTIDVLDCPVFAGCP